jgi:L,D-transpeptidase catalytic domain
MISQFAAPSIERTRRLGIPAGMTLVVTATLMALMATGPADAAKRRVRHEGTAAEASATRDAGAPIMAIVSIKSQKVTIYDSEGWILRAPVSSGTTGRETAAGIFSVLQKDKDHHSNLYDDAWMPNMLRITWSGIALHGGPLPGYPASHGCVRMPYGFADKIFDKVQIGMRVIIAPNDVEPVEISHPALFAPKSEAIAGAPSRAETLAREADIAAKMAQEAKSAAAKAAREAASVTALLRNVERLKIRADAELVQAEKAVADAKTDQIKARAEERKQKAVARVAELEAQLNTAKANAKSKLDAAAAAEEAYKTAESKRDEVAKAAREAKLALEPVSVFISRAKQRLYVRRGFEQVLDVPITIRDPDKAIGTHVFTAVARTAGGLRWTAATIDGGESARAALDRITIPQDVLDRIAPTASLRSSLIISDEPLNRETNDRTEFVVVLNDQPQGGLAMRKRPANVRTARRNDESFGWRGWGFQYDNTRQRGGQYYDQRRNGQNYYQWPQRYW